MAFPSITTALDDFTTYADFAYLNSGAPAKWGSLDIASSHAEGIYVIGGRAGWDGVASDSQDIPYVVSTSVGPDLQIWLTSSTINADAEFIEVWARVTNPGTLSASGYRGRVSFNSALSASIIEIDRVDNGVMTAIGTASIPGAGAITGVGLELIGTAINLYVQAFSSNWLSEASAVDGTYSAAGSVGFGTNLTPGSTSGVIQVGGGSSGPPPQEAHPASVISSGTWTPSVGTLASTVDEDQPDDSDYDFSALSPAVADVFEVKLGALTDPASSSGHSVSYRIGKDVTGGDRIDMTVRLMQGATQIAAWTHSSVSSVTTYTQPLTAAQADAITDYTDLRLRFEAVVV